nr:MAG TPA: tail protein [Caudoviricetes sp.]
MIILKEMIVYWDILKNVNFYPIFFLQGDYGVGILKINLKNLENFQGNLRAVFCSSNNPTEPYAVEKEIDSTINANIDIDIPNEILQGFGKVFCRLVLRSSDRGKIVGSIQEVYFHVVEKKDWEFLEPLLPSDEKEYVKDVVDELYEILKNSKNELKEYADQLKDDMQKDIITLEEAQAIIDKYKNQNKE